MTLQEMLDRECDLAYSGYKDCKERLDLLNLIKEKRGSKYPSCFGQDDCSSKILSMCPSVMIVENKVNLSYRNILYEADALDIFLEADKFYALELEYHNIRHANRVVETVCQLTEVPSVELLLAARWHDAIYIPGSLVNEAASGDALLYTYRRFQNDISLTSAVIEGAMDLIRKTTVSHHLTFFQQTGDLAILLDADLVALADDYETFCYNQQDILFENLLTSASFDKSALFLRKFLTCRDKIYHTDKGRELFEEKARSNIERFCSEYL